MDTTTIFLYFVFACFGAAVGAFIQQRLQKKPPETPPPTAPGNDLPAKGDHVILRAWRTSGGKVWLEMDETRLEDKEALNLDQRRKLLNLVLDLRPWLETAPPPTPEAAPRPAPAPEAAPRPAPAIQAATTPRPPLPQEAQPAPVLKSIVEQIDDVLQAKLAASPFKDRDIRLLEAPGGGVIVQVDHHKYEGIDAVPEQEVQALIRQAAAEWEKRAK